ncbi:MAG: hypothetical protein WBD31_28065 [Rubripirellula sp.]
MSTVTKIELAVELAERMMKERGYKHGTCLGAKLEKGDEDLWHVEFAYEGMADRSQTTDPPSIVLAVKLASEEVQPVELM